MLKISYWKVLLCIAVFIISVAFSMPTFLPSGSALHNVLPARKVNLGLDLRGGAYILLEMQMDAYEREMSEKALDGVRAVARKHGVALMESKLEPDGAIVVKLGDAALRDNLVKAAREAIGDIYYASGEGAALKFNKNAMKAEERQGQLMAQTIEIVRRRVDETGTREIDLQRQGDNYILLQVPGVEDPSEIRNLLGKTAKLGFHLVSSYGAEGYTPGTKVLPLEDGKSGAVIQITVQSKPIITGDMLVDAQTGLHDGAPVVTFRFNQMGAKLFGEVSAKNIGRAFAIVLDDVVISAPVIREAILSGSGQISGNFTMASANELALLLRAGALPVPLKVVEERSVGPSLGMDSIIAGSKATILGGALVFVFMFVFYYWFGLIANVALCLNLLMIIAVLSLFDATLTLPGIAGIVLTLGMAVDANVLICERIREELSKGRTPLSAIETGYKMAFGTIFDSNITTILVGVILYAVGVGPVKGFAVTLVIGILCSMFTAVTVTKLIVAIWFRKVRPTKLVV